MGMVTIPMSELLICRTGVRGWHAIKPVDTNHDNQTTDMLGGLQLSIKFEDPEDREAVIHTGRSLGWCPPPGIEYDDDNHFFDLEDDNDENGQFPKGLEISLRISRAWIPVSLVQDLQGHTQQSTKDIKGYIRYKLYDKSPLCSRVVTIRHANKEASILDVKHTKSFIVPGTTSLVWYLREESLEAQVWLRGTTRKDKDDGAVLPGQRDKLVGSAFINLSSLMVPGLKHSQISGVFPLFKAGADAMDGARVHVQIFLAKPNTYSHDHQMDEQDEFNDTVSSDDYPSTKGFADNDSTLIKTSSDQHPSDDINPVPQTPPRSTTSPPDDSFAAHVIVQEAHHLPTVPDSRGDRVPPNVYVSYKTTLSSTTTCTPVIKTTKKPVWEYQKLEHLPLSTLKTQNLVFKVWHRPAHTKNHETNSKKDNQPGSPPGDHSLGFASIDLAPLAAGLRQLIGWYNIMDFNGQCKGQIKVGVVPLAPVSPSRCLSRSRIHVSPPVSHMDKPLVTRFSSNSAPATFESTVLPNEFPYRNTAETDGLHHAKDTMDATNSREPILPTSTSSSFLFRQLRQNMQDLDNLQKGLQARLSGTSSGYHNRQDHHHHTEEIHGFHNPSTETAFSSTQNDSTFGAPTFLHIESNLSKHDLHSNKPNDIQQVKIPEGVEISQPEINMEKTKQSSDVLPEVFEQELTMNDYKQDKVTQTSNRQTVDIPETHQTDIEEEDFTHNEREDCNVHVGSDTQKLGNENDSDHDLDSLEEVSMCDKPYGESPLPYAQEIDSWLSSDGEDETKSPVTALAFKLPHNEPDIQAQKHVIHPDTLNENISTTHGEVDVETVDVNSHSESEIFEAINLFAEKPRNFSESDDRPGVLKNDYRENYHENVSISDNELNTGEISPDSRISDEQQESTSDTNQDVNNESCPKATTLPNFFMPTHQLENSMRALRLGAKLGYPHALASVPQSKLLERTYKSQDDDGKETEDILNQYSRKKVLYKAKQDMQPPLSSIEIDRIARIFSSKDK